MFPMRRSDDGRAPFRRKAIFAGMTLLAGLALASVAFFPSLANRAVATLEARLTAETGLALRIGAARLRWAPHPSIVLENVEIGEATGTRPGAMIAEALVRGDLATLFGGEGEWRAALSGVSARIPFAGAEAGAVEPRAPDAAKKGRDVSVRATVSGADLTFDASHAVVMRAAKAEIAFRFARGEKGRVDVELAGGAYRAIFTLEDSPGAVASGAPAVFSIAPPEGGEAWTSGRCLFAASAKELTCREIEGTAGGARFSGSAAITLAAAPAASLDLHLQELTLGERGGAPRGGFSVDPGAFGDFPVTARIGVETLRIGPVRAGGVDARVTADGAGIDLAIDAHRFYEGSARGRYTVAADAGRLHQLSLSVKGSRMSPLLRDVADAGALDGRADAHLEAQARGANPRELLASARGGGDIAIVDGRVSGAAISDLLEAPLVSDFFASDKGALTTFTRFSGSFAIANGKAASRDLHFDSRILSASGRGTADLEAATLDFTFRAAPVAGGAARKALRIPVRVSGPWKNPSVSANLDSLLENPLATLQSLGDVGAALFGDDFDSDDPKTKKGGELGKARHRR